MWTCYGKSDSCILLWAPDWLNNKRTSVRTGKKITRPACKKLAKQRQHGFIVPLQLDQFQDDVLTRAFSCCLQCLSAILSANGMQRNRAELLEQWAYAGEAVPITITSSYLIFMIARLLMQLVRWDSWLQNAKQTWYYRKSFKMKTGGEIKQNNPYSMAFS